MEDSTETIRRPVTARVTTVLATTVLAATSLTLSGCARGFTSPDVEEFGTFRIDVTNDLAPRAEIYLQSNVRGPAAAAEGIHLGSAPVEGTTVFRIDVEDPSATYRLRALMPRNREVVSESFVPTEVGPGIHWTLSDNLLAEETTGEAAGAGTGGGATDDGAATDRPGTGGAATDRPGRGAAGRSPSDARSGSEATAGDRGDRGGTRSPTGARVLPPGG